MLAEALLFFSIGVSVAFARRDWGRAVAGIVFACLGYLAYTLVTDKAWVAAIVGAPPTVFSCSYARKALDELAASLTASLLAVSALAELCRVLALVLAFAMVGEPNLAYLLAETILAFLFSAVLTARNLFESALVLVHALRGLVDVAENVAVLLPLAAALLASPRLWGAAKRLLPFLLVLVLGVPAAVNLAGMVPQAYVPQAPSAALGWLVVRVNASDAVVLVLNGSSGLYRLAVNGSVGVYPLPPGNYCVVGAYSVWSRVNVSETCFAVEEDRVTRVEVEMAGVLVNGSVLLGPTELTPKSLSEAECTCIVTVLLNYTAEPALVLVVSNETVSFEGHSNVEVVEQEGNETLLRVYPSVTIVAENGTSVPEGEWEEMYGDTTEFFRWSRYAAGLWGVDWEPSWEWRSASVYRLCAGLNFTCPVNATCTVVAPARVRLVWPDLWNLRDAASVAAVPGFATHLRMFVYLLGPVGAAVASAGYAYAFLHRLAWNCFWLGVAAVALAVVPGRLPGWLPGKLNPADWKAGLRSWFHVVYPRVTVRLRVRPHDEEERGRPKRSPRGAARRILGALTMTEYGAYRRLEKWARDRRRDGLARAMGVLSMGYWLHRSGYECAARGLLRAREEIEERLAAERARRQQWEIAAELLLKELGRAGLRDELLEKALEEYKRGRAGEEELYEAMYGAWSKLPLKERGRVDRWFRFMFDISFLPEEGGEG